MTLLKVIKVTGYFYYDFIKGYKSNWFLLFNDLRTFCDNFKRLVKLKVITISGFYCITVTNCTKILLYVTRFCKPNRNTCDLTFKKKNWSKLQKYKSKIQSIVKINRSKSLSLFLANTIFSICSTIYSFCVLKENHLQLCDEAIWKRVIVNAAKTLWANKM